MLGQNSETHCLVVCVVGLGTVLLLTGFFISQSFMGLWQRGTSSLTLSWSFLEDMWETKVDWKKALRSDETKIELLTIRVDAMACKEPRQCLHSLSHFNQRNSFRGVTGVWVSLIPFVWSVSFWGWSALDGFLHVP